ncbi:MAG TPA: hypothetical protein VNM89_05860, partial [Solirubrobacterales bacterium]|nr:hypothetical protein [Solirubrobacterales bacterium]
GAAPAGKAPLARRLLAGSLDRAVDVAATLELRGYSLPNRPSSRRHAFDSKWMPNACHRKPVSRYDARFYAVGATVLVAAIVGKLLGADDFSAYPTITIGTDPLTLALSALVGLVGLAPLRRKPAGKRTAPKVTTPTQPSPLEPSSA